MSSKYCIRRPRPNQVASFTDQPSQTLTNDKVMNSSPANSFLRENVTPTTTIRLTSSSDRAGLGITETTMGNPSRTVVIVKFVMDDGIAKSCNVLPGMIILGYNDMKSVVKRMKCGPFPFELSFYDPLVSACSKGEYITPYYQLPEKLTLSSAEVQRKKSMRNFVTQGFGVVHSHLFGWVDEVMKESVKMKSPQYKDANAALDLSTEMEEKVNKGQFHEALAIANKALEMQRKHSGSNHKDVGRMLNFIGVILSQVEESHSYMALTSFEESLMIMQETKGHGDEETSYALHNMWLLLHNVRERQKEDESERNEIHTYKGALPIEG